MEISSENKKLIQSISKFYLSSELSDVDFLVKGEKVPAHKMILAMASPVFKAMFFGPIKEKDVVEIVDASVDGFKEFLQLFYLGEVKLTIEKIEEVFRLADKYDMMTDGLKMFTTFDDSNFTMEKLFLVYKLAISQKNDDLKKCCEIKMINMWPARLFKSKAFLQCDQQILNNILLIDSLLCDEIDIFRACIAWAKNACRKNGLDDNASENLRSQLGECFYSIRFGTIPANIFSDQLYNDTIKDMFSRDELFEIFSSSANPYRATKIFNRYTRLGTAKWKLINPMVCNIGEGFLSNIECELQPEQSLKFFTTDNKSSALLKEIDHATLFHKFRSAGNYPYVEYDMHILNGYRDEDILFTKKGTIGNSTKIELSPPFVVAPYKSYIIKGSLKSE